MKNLMEDGVWKSLANALRDEVQEYSWLLELLEKQQKNVFEREYEKLPDLTMSITEQIGIASNRRKNREDLQLNIHEEMGTEPNTKVRDLFPYLPDASLGLFEELMTEAKSIIIQLQKRTQQNKFILNQTSEYTQEILKLIMPRDVSRTYGVRGDVHIKALRKSRTLNVKA